MCVQSWLFMSAVHGLHKDKHTAINRNVVQNTTYVHVHVYMYIIIIICIHMYMYIYNWGDSMYNYDRYVNSKLNSGKMPSIYTLYSAKAFYYYRKIALALPVWTNKCAQTYQPWNAELSVSLCVHIIYMYVHVSILYVPFMLSNLKLCFTSSTEVHRIQHFNSLPLLHTCTYIYLY